MRQWTGPLQFQVNMMTSSNGHISRVTGHLCGEFTGPLWIPHTKASDAEVWCFFDLRLNKRLSKQSWGWWFQTLSRSFWRHCNGVGACSVPRHCLNQRWVIFIQTLRTTETSQNGDHFVRELKAKTSLHNNKTSILGFTETTHWATHSSSIYPSRFRELLQNFIFQKSTVDVCSWSSS